MQARLLGAAIRRMLNRKLSMAFEKWQFEYERAKAPLSLTLTVALTGEYPSLKVLLGLAAFTLLAVAASSLVMAYRAASALLALAASLLVLAYAGAQGHPTTGGPGQGQRQR